jgi:aldose 1-epimerase
MYYCRQTYISSIENAGPYLTKNGHKACKQATEARRIVNSSKNSVQISSGTARVEILPALGATLSYWQIASLDILRPRRSGTVDPLESACFPLAPFSNIIGGGGLQFDGHFFPLAPNHLQEPLPIHGDAWLAAWSVIAVDASAVRTYYAHDGRDGFPFRYTVFQRVRLHPWSLAVSLALVNSDCKPFPAGLGLHPYFQKPTGTRLQLGHRGVWDGARIKTDTRFLSTQALPEAGIDDCFVGWNRSARLIWPNQGIQIRIVASSHAGSLVVFSPATADFVCIEPVSHVNDGINVMAAGSSGTGVRVLRPGQSLTLAIVIHVEPTDYAERT